MESIVLNPVNKLNENELKMKNKCIFRKSPMFKVYV